MGVPPKSRKDQTSSGRRGALDKGKATASNHVKKPKKPTVLQRIDKRKKTTSIGS